MSKDSIQLLSKSSKILYSYFQERFTDAVITDMTWTDESDAMINLKMLYLEGDIICSEITKIAMEEISAIISGAI